MINESRALYSVLRTRMLSYKGTTSEEEESRNCEMCHNHRSFPGSWDLARAVRQQLLQKTLSKLMEICRNTTKAKPERVVSEPKALYTFYSPFKFFVTLLILFFDNFTHVYSAFLLLSPYPILLPIPPSYKSFVFLFCFVTC